MDIYTPVNTSPDAITRAIEGKNKQATAVMVQTNIAEAGMATVAARTWGKPAAKNIQISFSKSRIYNKPIGG